MKTNDVLQAQLVGHLTINTVQLLRDRLSSQLANNDAENIFIDLSAFTSFDTAGLALLIELKKICKSNSKSLCFLKMSDNIKSLAKFYDVVDIFD